MCGPGLHGVHPWYPPVSRLPFHCPSSNTHRYEKDCVQADLDTIVISSVGGRLSISDMHTHAYGPSWPDAQQNVNVGSLEVVNGTLRARFSRPSWASESQTDHDLRGCVPWQVYRSSLKSAGHRTSARRCGLVRLRLGTCTCGPHREALPDPDPQTGLSEAV